MGGWGKGIGWGEGEGGGKQGGGRGNKEKVVGNREERVKGGRRWKGRKWAGWEKGWCYREGSLQTIPGKICYSRVKISKKPFFNATIHFDFQISKMSDMPRALNGATQFGGDQIKPLRQNWKSLPRTFALVFLAGIAERKPLLSCRRNRKRPRWRQRQDEVVFGSRVAATFFLLAFQEKGHPEIHGGTLGIL